MKTGLRDILPTCVSEYSLEAGAIKEAKCSYCDILSREKLALHTEVLSLTEIVNVLNYELQVLRKTINTRTNSDPRTSESTLPLPKHLEMNKHQKTTKRHLNEEMNSTNIPQQLNLKVDDGPVHINDSSHQHHSKETFALHNATIENYYMIPTSNSFAVLTNVKDQLDGEYTQVLKQGDVSLKTYPTSHKRRESTNISV